MTATERTEFLAERRKGLGASDIAAIFGMSKWTTAVGVWADKCSLLDDTAITGPQDWGIRLEEPIAKAFTDRTQIALDRPLWPCVCADLPILRSNLDFTGVGSNVFIDCKNSGRLKYKDQQGQTQAWGPDMSDEVPTEILFQLQTQYACVGWETGGFVAALIGGNDFRIYQIERSQPLIEKIMGKAEEFWERFVKPRIEPEHDWSHRATAELVKKLNPPDAGSTLDLQGDEEFVRVAEDFNILRAAEKHVKAMKDSAKAKLTALSQGAALVTWPDGKFTHKIVKKKAYTVKAQETPTVNLTVTADVDVSFILDRLPRGYGGGNGEDSDGD